MRRTHAEWLIALAAVFVAARAAAQGTPTTTTLPPELAAQRRLLIERAQQAARAGRHDEAVDLGTRAAAIQTSPSLSQLVAAAELARGHSGEAVQLAASCVNQTLENPATPNRDRQLQTCRALMTEAAARVGYVVVAPPTSLPPSLRISVGGRELPPPLYRTPFAVTPGAVLVEGTAPGFVAFRQQVDVQLGATVDIAVALDPERDAAARPSGAGANGVTGTAAEPACAAGTVARNGRCVERAQPVGGPQTGAGNTMPLQRVVGFGVAGGAVVALGFGIVANVVRNDRVGLAERDACNYLESGPEPGAPMNCTEHYDAVVSAQTVSLFGYVAAAALAATSVALVLTAPSASARTDAPPRARFGCGAGPGTLGLACGATF